MGKSRFLIVGLALALAMSTLCATQSLASSDHSPTKQVFLSANYDFGLANFQLSPAYAQAEVIFVEDLKPTVIVEAKAAKINKYVEVPTLVKLRSWRISNERDYGELSYRMKSTTMLDLPDKTINSIRWKDLHRRC